MHKHLSFLLACLFCLGVATAHGQSGPSTPTARPSGAPSGHPGGHPGAPGGHPGSHAGAPAPSANDPAKEAVLLSGIHQVTFGGLRSGEGYFSADGTRMVFQSERDPSNPFYQIHVMDFRTGDTWRVSTGTGKTTCAWIHPDGTQVLFASTHADPESKRLQEAELEARAKGTQKRYAWDFDDHYQIYSAPIRGGALVPLTNARGYNAEASWSPDGKWIVFASNRHAYSEPLSPEEKALFEKDPSSQLDIYRMRADGTGVERLTRHLGYDGGPFYSADGKSICWRRFSADGATAEIFVMDSDGRNPRQITRMGVMSWAPYFHPSGDYLVFATNKQGHANFELYLVDAAGKREPIRVTWSDGFDGLPVFTPDGGHVAWTSSRTAEKKPQIFMARWSDTAARRLLGLKPAAPAAPTGASTGTVGSASTRASGAVLDGLGPAKGAVERIGEDVRFLAADPLEGRLTGTPGEMAAAERVIAVFRSLGLEPAGDSGSFLQALPFTAGVSMGAGNRLALAIGASRTEKAVDREWRPLAFSRNGPTGAAPVAFAGYGIVAPAANGQAGYDSYGNLDVKGRWVLVLRYMPEDVAPAERQHLAHYAALRYKAMQARDRGAIGIIVASGPRAGVKDPLVKLSMEAAMSGSTIAGLSVDDAVAEAMLAASGRSLKDLQERLDRRQEVPGFVLPEVRVEATVDIRQETRIGHNVIGRLPASGTPRVGCVVVGAHMDHLGHGLGGNSLARGEARGRIHPGADDNASGVGCMLEIARQVAAMRKAGTLAAKRDVLFVAWSGEELGVLGSAYFTRMWKGARRDAGTIAPGVAAYLNMDMVGRLKDRVMLQGLGSSSAWPGALEWADAPLGLGVSLQQVSYLPTDATPFYVAGVPVLNAFTGAHADYHTPMDTAEKLSYDGVAVIERLLERLTVFLARAETAPDHRKTEKPATSGSRAGLRVFLGTIPDYGGSEGQGLRLSGVIDGGPAAKAGLQGGDVIVELTGKKIRDVHDYMYVLEGLKIGQGVSIVVQRAGKEIRATIVPGQRD